MVSPDPRHHFYLVRCEECPQLVKPYDKKPIAADRYAHRHAKQRPGHTVHVYNLTTLTVTHTYHLLAFDVELPDEPPF